MSTEHLQYLTTYEHNDKFRLGNKGDGGYVIANLSGNYDCYISAGVNDEESFSKEFIEYYNMDLSNNYAFDGTIESYPYIYTKNILSGSLCFSTRPHKRKLVLFPPPRLSRH